MWQTKNSLAEWKSLRKRISTENLDVAISEVSKFWSYAPFVSHYLEPDNPGDWPNPWQLLDDNYFCDLAKALGMFYTLGLSSHGSSIDIELRIYVDPNNNYSHLVWIDQGKYIVNYWHDEVVNKTQVDEDLTLKHRYTAADLNLHNY